MNPLLHLVPVRKPINRLLHLMPGRRTPMNPLLHLMPGSTPINLLHQLEPGRTPINILLHLEPERTSMNPLFHLMPGSTPMNPLLHLLPGRTPINPLLHLMPGSKPINPLFQLEPGLYQQLVTGTCGTRNTCDKWKRTLHSTICNARERPQPTPVVNDTAQLAAVQSVGSVLALFVLFWSQSLSGSHGVKTSNVRPSWVCQRTVVAVDPLMITVAGSAADPKSAITGDLRTRTVKVERFYPMS
ncbi:hypothetical protein XELAEV_18046352mg [Xenopus laevis]|uniref:Uncharacterized protein n=1 Tax=Xenopus laevis TaxID=8355 RepID=A0A974BTH9_XENLA|nr:hypothetical protein XELAEV_18046352mg [Xenopus laevis]